MLALETEVLIPEPTVLLVDRGESRVQLFADREDARDCSAKLLRGEGIRVKVAESGELGCKVYMRRESHFGFDESPDF